MSKHSLFACLCLFIWSIPRLVIDDVQFLTQVCFLNSEHLLYKALKHSISFFMAECNIYVKGKTENFYFASYTMQQQRQTAQLDVTHWLIPSTEKPAAEPTPHSPGWFLSQPQIQWGFTLRHRPHTYCRTIYQVTVDWHLRHIYK